jgi:hypothetical protein
MFLDGPVEHLANIGLEIRVAVHGPTGLGVNFSGEVAYLVHVAVDLLSISLDK